MIDRLLYNLIHARLNSLIYVYLLRMSSYSRYDRLLYPILMQQSPDNLCGFIAVNLGHAAVHEDQSVAAYCAPTKLEVCLNVLNDKVYCLNS